MDEKKVYVLTPYNGGLIDISDLTNSTVLEAKSTIRDALQLPEGDYELRSYGLNHDGELVFVLLQNEEIFPPNIVDDNTNVLQVRKSDEWYRNGITSDEELEKSIRHMLEAPMRAKESAEALRAEGADTKAREIATNMLYESINPETVASCTGINKEELKELQFIGTSKITEIPVEELKALAEANNDTPNLETLEDVQIFDILEVTTNGWTDLFMVKGVVVNSRKGQTDRNTLIQMIGVNTKREIEIDYEKEEGHGVSTYKPSNIIIKNQITLKNLKEGKNPVMR